MLVNQIAVFLENKQGKLNSLVNAISEKGINIQSLNIADTNDFGIVRMVTTDNEAAIDVIRSSGFTATSVDLLGIEVVDEPGSLSKFLKVLSDEGIEIEYMYSYAVREGKTLILVKTADVLKAQKLLKDIM